MSISTKHRFVLIAIVLTIVGGPFSRPAPLTLAQSQTEKPKLKKFGASLKRLEWDPVTQAAVETASPQVDDGIPVEDVFRITTELVVCDVKVLDKQGGVVTGLTRNDLSHGRRPTPASYTLLTRQRQRHTTIDSSDYRLQWQLASVLKLDGRSSENTGR